MSAVEVLDVVKRYGVKHKPVEALAGVTLDVETHEVFGLLGSNGAGKTTLMRILCRLLVPSSGTVMLFGTPHYSLQNLGVVLEGNRNLYWRLTAFENLVYYGVTRARPLKETKARAKELLERFGLGAKTNVTVQKLSRGMQQKVALAAALIHRPKVLILDEPTLGLDISGVADIEDLIRQIARSGESTVILATHDLYLANSLCDRVAVIEQGRILTCGNPAELVGAYLHDGPSLEVVVGGLSEEAVRQMVEAGVLVEERDVGYALHTDGCDSPALRRLLEVVLSTGVRITQIKSVEPSLRDVIKRIMAEVQKKVAS